MDNRFAGRINATTINPHPCVVGRAITAIATFVLPTPAIIRFPRFFQMFFSVYPRIVSHPVPGQIYFAPNSGLHVPFARKRRKSRSKKEGESWKRRFPYSTPVQVFQKIFTENEEVGFLFLFFLFLFFFFFLRARKPICSPPSGFMEKLIIRSIARL